MTYLPHTHSNRLGTGERGITMLEVTLLLGALVILSAAVAPALLRTVDELNAGNVLEEMEALHLSIMGDPVAGTFGYVGELGRFPYFMDELVLQLDAPLFVRSELSGIGYGWNGPYVVRGRDANDFRLDPWGNEYDIGEVGPGQLRSAGPNGIYDDEDDVIYPPYPVDLYGSLVVTVRGHSGDVVTNDPEGCAVALVFSAEGEADAVLDEVAPFSFEVVHRGLHEIEVACPTVSGELVTEVGVASIRGGGAQQVIELHVELGEELPDASDGASAETESAGQSDVESAGTEVSK